MPNVGAAERYALSFTSGALLVREAAIAAPVYLDTHDWTRVQYLLDLDNLLQARTRSTAKRRSREVVQRLARLGVGELTLLVDGTREERGHLLWVAVCRRYRLIAEFAEEVVRERFLLFAGTLGYDEFDSFVRAKALWHEELTVATDATLQKLRSNVFRMLQEAELVSTAGEIVPAVLSERVMSVISRRPGNDLRFFPSHQTTERGADL